MKIAWIPAQEQDTACMTALRKEIRPTAYRGIYPGEAIEHFDFPRTKSGTWRRFGIKVTQSF